MKKIVLHQILGSIFLIHFGHVHGQVADAELLHITDGVLAVYYDDGYIQHDPDYRKSKLFAWPIDISKAQDPSNYQLESTNDPNYASPTAPLTVTRKSKGLEFADVYSGSYYNMGHWMYLKLPYALQSGKSYTLKIELDQLDQSEFSFVYDPPKLRSEAVHVSQVGFQPESKKYGYLSYWMGDGGSLSLDEYAGNEFHLINVQTDQPKYTGVINKRKSLQDGSPDTNTALDGNPRWFRGRVNLDANFTMADVWECDFSSFSTAGTYRLVVDGIGGSYPFEIKEDVYREPFRYALKSLFWQRAGVEKEISPGKIYPRGVHPDNGTQKFYLQKGWRWIDEPKHRGEVKNTSPANDFPIWGWYYDAGDWDTYPHHAEVPLALLLAYDFAPTNYQDGDLENSYKSNADNEWVREGGNGIPDILDEARWLIEYYKRAKDLGLSLGLTTGGVPGGYGGRDAGATSGFPSWEDTRDLQFLDEDPMVTFMYAALATYYAQCLDLYKGSVHSESAAWIMEAKNAYDWAVTHTQVGDYDFEDYRDARLLAALALFRYTGDPSYHAAFVSVFNYDKRKFNQGQNSWYEFYGWELAAMIYGRMPQDTPNLDVDLQSEIIEKLTQVVDSELISSADDRGYRMAWDWDKSTYLGTFTTPNFYLLAAAHQITKDPKYLDVMRTTADYFLGGNPQNNVQISGLGHQSESTPFHPDSWFLNNDDDKVRSSPILPGYSVYGSVAEDVEGLDPGNPLDRNKIRWSGDEEYSHLSAYPFSPKDTWPFSEVRFENRMSIDGSEFTIRQNNAMNIFSYGYLLSDREKMAANGPPSVALASPPPYEPLPSASASTFSVSASDDLGIYKVEYFLDWIKIGESSDEPDFLLTIEDLPAYASEVTEVYAVAWDLKGAKSKVNVSLLPKTAVLQTESLTSTVYVYPNPVRKGFEVTLTGLASEPSLVTVYDLNGQVFYSRKYPTTEDDLKIVIPKIATGVYVISITQKDKSIRYRLIIE